MCINVSVRLTVYFDDPFWVGVFEKHAGGELSVCRVVFGGEPKDGEIYEIILNGYYNLRFSEPATCDGERPKAMAANPKRMQRQAKKQTAQKGISTKSQDAVRQQREQNKTERRASSKLLRQADEKRLFEMKQQKKKQKHKGH